MSLYTSKQINALRLKKEKKYRVLTRWLFKSPQKRGDCIKTLKLSPKKPNSAERAAAHIWTRGNKKKLYVYIPGIKHTISQHTTLLYRGGKTQDLPRLRYKVIRGALNVGGVVGRTKARSKYGVKRKED